MKHDHLTLDKLRELSILEVADKLGFTLKGLGDEGRRALCPYHDDKHPSLHFSKKKGIFKCFVCGAKGDLFKLVMDSRNCTFAEACDWLIQEFHVVVITNTNLPNPTDAFSNPQLSTFNSQLSTLYPLPSALLHLPSDLVLRSLSLNSQFCQSVVSAGYLTDEQLRHAADRYRLGCSKDGGVIFWEIDDRQRVHTGKIMYYQPDCHRDKQHPPTWIHSLMKDQVPKGYELQHCLFGLHLLTSDLSHQPSVVCIVESEKTAVMMSMIRPECLWMSCGGLQMFKPELLTPLVDHKVVIFPDTDPQGEAFRQWSAVVQEAQRLYRFRYPIRVSPILERHATPEQKSLKIDLVDFLFRIPNS